MSEVLSSVSQKEENNGDSDAACKDENDEMKIAYSCFSLS